MTAATAPRALPIPAPATHGPVPFRHLVQAEWTKLRSVRSTRRFVPIVLVLAFGMSLLAAVLTRSSYPSWSRSEQVLFDPLNHALICVAVAQFATAILGVLAMTGEHSSGTLRTTLMGTPVRDRVLAAKAMVVGVASLVAGVVVIVPSFVVSQVVLHGAAPTVGLTDLTVVRGLALSTGYLVAVSLIGVAVGTLVRHSAGAIAAVIGFVFAVPSVVAMLPHSIADAVMQYLPMVIAGSSLSTTIPEPHSLGPWSGSAVVLVYVVLFGATALARFRHRDA
jgi:ABC-type transport system involved in multi-copper enzyme maturation permease subunit